MYADAGVFPPQRWRDRRDTGHRPDERHIQFCFDLILEHAWRIESWRVDEPEQKYQRLFLSP